MRIVVNALSARLGGGQTYVRNLFAHLPDSDDLEVLIFAPDQLDLPEDDRIRRVRTTWPTTNPYLRTLWERFLLPAFLRRTQADVLFCPGGVVTTRVPRRCRVVTMFRNMMPFDPSVWQRLPLGGQRLRNMLLRRLMLKSLMQADLTIFISEYARQVIEALGRIPNPVTIPHGVGEVFRTHGRAVPRPEFLPSGEYMLYVSRFDVYKHHYEVVTAYSNLTESLQSRFALILAGETNSLEADRIRSLIVDRRLVGRVYLLGGVRYLDLPAVYHHAKLNLFASSCENCPNILLETLGAGRPVLSSNVMPMPEFGGDAVHYFSPDDPEDIRRAMEAVLDDETYAERLGAAAAERAKRYDWALTSKKTWASIFSLIERRPEE
ncbi:MAG: glycosyltransferase family 4 protein [Proteobacteria bacterium]|nr:glycosyltransferase family 4 protein [Pseudomonadota bacterium]